MARGLILLPAGGGGGGYYLGEVLDPILGAYLINPPPLFDDVDLTSSDLLNVSSPDRRRVMCMTGLWPGCELIFEASRRVTWDII